eukprot:12084422-Karenia_brevis.AAC.1
MMLMMMAMEMLMVMVMVMMMMMMIMMMMTMMMHVKPWTAIVDGGPPLPDIWKSFIFTFQIMAVRKWDGSGVQKGQVSRGESSMNE